MSTQALAPTSLRGQEAKRLRVGLTMSAVVHVGIVGALVFWSTRPEPLRPPVYRVNLVGAPPGVPQIGVVDRRPAAPTQSQKPAPSGAEQIAPPEKVVPTRKTSKTPAQLKATPTPTPSRTAGSRDAKASTQAEAPPKAASGATGAKGADVVTVRTEGLAFPDQGYLDNIIRQLRVVWNPEEISAIRVAELKFTIRRDGSVADISVVKRSGDRMYDIEAQGAIEAVSTARKFGPLPTAWTDDVLIVYFTFDYSKLK